MRIGVVTTSYPRHPRDFAGSFVAGMTRWLVREGHEVEVIAAGPGDDEVAPIPVTRVHAGERLFAEGGAPEALERSRWSWRYAPLFTAALARAVARRHWDAVVSHWLAPAGLATSLATRIPHLAIAHSGDVHLLARRGIAEVATRILLSGPTHVSFVSEALRSRLLSTLSLRTRVALETRSSVCPMGVEVEPWDRTAARKHLRLPDGPIVAFLGRLVPVKGVDVLLEAVRELEGVTTVIAGEGPPPVAGMFLGPLAPPERDALLAAADVLVVPSRVLPGGRTEGMPVVVLEALAAGLPVVASDVGGIREIGGDTTLLVRPGSPRDLAAAIRRALAGPRPVPRADLSWNVVGARLLAGLASERDAVEIDQTHPARTRDGETEGARP